MSKREDLEYWLEHARHQTYSTLAKTHPAEDAEAQWIAIESILNYLLERDND